MEKIHFCCNFIGGPGRTILVVTMTFRESDLSNIMSFRLHTLVQKCSRVIGLNERSNIFDTGRHSTKDNLFAAHHMAQGLNSSKDYFCVAEVYSLSLECVHGLCKKREKAV